MSQAEQLVDGLSRELALQVVQRVVDGRTGGLLSRRQACRDLVERKRIVTELDAVQPPQRGCRRLLVALDRGRLAVPGDTLMLHLDLDHIRVVLGATRDREGLRELHLRHASREFHERKTSAAARRELRELWRHPRKGDA